MQRRFGAVHDLLGPLKTRSVTRSTADYSPVLPPMETAIITFSAWSTGHREPERQNVSGGQAVKSLPGAFNNILTSMCFLR
ncbi:hypothetical protein PoB_005397200 [Plakobranchus ocellatus]|uniref:Uncharacterized protein n=1 Tax=Plakobranchus ocellatus TaxID=259542 RepID=A0AAV4C853_9GAST|nr:hypothetical protein PoB_005397200 [Plakobranchus ocellatus]